jgi:hypothetical protein
LEEKSYIGREETVKKRADNTEKRMSVGREMSRKKGDE